MSKKKLIVVTGGAGFIGSHLCERLVREGYHVISLDNYFTGSPANHVPGVEYRTGHTKDIAKIIPETPDILYHLGEYSRVEKSFEDVELVWDLNKLGTFAVLEFWRRTRCKLLYAGSSTKFADGGEGRDQSPYAWSKATNTELVKNYATWFGLRYAITYFYNVYGPREMSDAYGTLIGIFHSLYKNGQPLTVVAPGTQVRNFTHVSDIVEGLICVGEKGEGDDFGIGSETTYSVLDVARMFDREILMMPEREGNRKTSVAQTTRTKELGWKATQTLPKYIEELKSNISPEKTRNGVLVFSTTFYPDRGKAEEALMDLMRIMPSVHFDVITTKFSKQCDNIKYAEKNVTVHRVGWGSVYDKYLLPFLGARVAKKLKKNHEYLFSWSLFASYAALAALFSRGSKSNHILITIADQKLSNIPWYTRFVLRYILSNVDQVYADDTHETRAAISLSKRISLVRSIGSGDAFANQIRFTYSSILKKRTPSHEI